MRHSARPKEISTTDVLPRQVKQNISIRKKRGAEADKRVL
ncbi:hypothetical protein ECL_01509 [Enterobacter cloacae subsp. cloacae ATCC 13047]|uniref:Uncharacterized protein n=1 Tax=Enterobacter cloacae subsp. cloacae (strain ATCC 13047 / DSM 30054 / NBRC 13535 / NCTC 10005 / WDCM 00083 / NCDC 279-56) TaxID=716541 RepID=A0A0H3CKJ1_ENTCC|nr:hypothetical protein ECL_01509 [Enterobacter cloacae subsp. cloacae ATCC 13047]